MAQFNFTVRATDSEGSFADRNFSINVRNTRVDRYLAVTTADAYTSVDGNTWAVHSGAGGNLVAFNNLTWYIMTLTGIKISNDAINFNEILFSDSRIVFKDMLTGEENPTFIMKTATVQSYPSNFIKHGNYISCIVYVNNSRYYIRSLDGMTWEYQPASFLPAANANTILNKALLITYDSPTLFIGSQIGGASTVMGYKSEDNGKTWTTVTRSSTTFQAGWLGRINGFYMAFTTYSGGQLNMMTSSDGVNWISNAFTAVTNYVATINRVSAIYYLNGRLVAVCEKPTSSTQTGLFIMHSLDGVSWTMYNAGTAYSSGTVLYQMASTMRNGKIVLLPTLVGTQSGIKWSTDGLTFTAIPSANSGLPATTFNDMTSM